MEKFQKFLKKFAFFEGFALGVLACVWIYTTFVKEGYEQVKIKYELIKEDYDKKAAFEDKYHQEQLHSHEFEIKTQNLQSDLENSQNKYKALADAKWEEKFNAEHLARISADEQLASAQGRISGLNSETEQRTKDYETLIAKLEATVRERDALKKFYTSGTPENTKPQTIQVPKNNFDADSVLAGLDGMFIFEIGGFIISAAPQIKGGIPPDTFIKILGKASVFDRPNVVINVAKYQ